MTTITCVNENRRSTYLLIGGGEGITNILLLCKLSEESCPSVCVETELTTDLYIDFVGTVLQGRRNTSTMIGSWAWFRASTVCSCVALDKSVPLT